jgi:hypothetical protein
MARGQDLSVAAGAAAEVLPGAEISVRPDGTRILVTGRYHATAPLPVLRELGAHLSAELVVRPEQWWSP